jgi:hypothetical protein
MGVHWVSTIHKLGDLRLRAGRPHVFAAFLLFGTATQAMNVYVIKMAGVFMFSTSTTLLRTKIVPRWIAFLGYALGVALPFSAGLLIAP